MRTCPRSRDRALVLVSLVSMSTAFLFAHTARAQGVTATVKPVTSSAPADVAAMKRRVDELERRVLELEKEKAENIELARDEEAAAKKLEQRLAAIESAQKEAETAAKNSETAAKDSHFEPMNVRAPFVVRDDAGNVLMRVDRSQAGFARLAVGDLLGSRVVLAAGNGKESVVELTNPANTVKYKAQVTSTTASVLVVGEQGWTVMGTGKDGLSAIQVVNKAGIPVAELVGMGSQSGRLQITNGAGDAMVVAAVSTKGGGVVKTGPNGNGAAALLGMAGLPASEIQGRLK